jgi:hypothetical protein
VTTLAKSQGWVERVELRCCTALDPADQADDRRPSLPAGSTLPRAAPCRGRGVRRRHDRQNRHGKAYTSRTDKRGGVDAVHDRYHLDGRLMARLPGHGARLCDVDPGWYRTDQPLEPWLVSPGEILSSATTRLSPTGHHVACASGIPQTVVDKIGPEGIYLWLGEWHPSASPYGTTPNPRPTHFADVAWTALCQLPNAMTAKEYTFTDSSRDFTAHLVVGANASADRTAQVYKMLDGLHFGT